MSDQRKSVYNGNSEKEKLEEVKFAAPSLEKIKKDIDSLQSDVTGLALDVRKVGFDKAHEAMSYVNKNVDSLKTTGADAFEKIEGRIKEKPGQSITIAFVTGMLISYLFSRKS